MNGANHGNEMQVPHQHGFLLPAQRSESEDEFSQMVLGPDGGARVQALNLAGTRDSGFPEVYASAPRRLAKQSFGRPDGNTPCIPLNGAPETEEAPVDMKWPSFQQPQAPVIQQSQLAQPLTIQPLVMQPPVMQIPFIQQPFIGNDVQPFGDRSAMHVNRVDVALTNRREDCTCVLHVCVVRRVHAAQTSISTVGQIHNKTKNGSCVCTRMHARMLSVLPSVIMCSVTQEKETQMN